MTLAHDPQMVVVYDNVNFKDTKRDELLGHTSVMRSLTTAAIVYCPELPPLGLLQSMHNPTIPLNVEDIYRSPGFGDELSPQISRYLIANAMKGIHLAGVERIFEDSDLFPQMPSIQCISNGKTRFWQFGAIMEDEGTIQGTYGVHKSIFLDQLGLQAPDNPHNSAAPDDFTKRLWLAHGDQLTAHHIRSVKREQIYASRPFDRRDWLLGVPAWFHIEMNLYNTLVRTHFAPEDKQEEAHHCLRSDMTLWNRSTITRENAKYHELVPVIERGFMARITALFYAAMERQGFRISMPDLSEPSNLDTLPNPSSPECIEDTTRAIGCLTPEQFLNIVDEIQRDAFSRDAWTGVKHNDVEFRTMCRMLQEVELLLTVRHAVKHADIGMLRRLVDPLIVFFFGASQHNYGREMLFYRWNLTSVNSPELQHAILSSGLVNWLGAPDRHKAIDLGLEHLNGSCKIEMKCYKNLTYNINIIFNWVYLSNI